MAEIDPVAALVSYLETESTLQFLIEGRVFGEELPAVENAQMPRACIVVMASGGGGNIGSSYQQFGDGRVDVRCYGPSTREAKRLANLVYVAIKTLKRTVEKSCLIHWARLAGGPIKLNDLDTDWPCFWMSWQLLAAEVAA